MRVDLEVARPLENKVDVEVEAGHFEVEHPHAPNIHTSLFGQNFWHA